MSVSRVQTSAYRAVRFVLREKLTNWAARKVGNFMTSNGLANAVCQGILGRPYNIGGVRQALVEESRQKAGLPPLYDVSIPTFDLSQGAFPLESMALLKNPDRIELLQTQWQLNGEAAQAAMNRAKAAGNKLEDPEKNQ